MARERFDPTTATWKQAKEYFSQWAPYMRDARTKDELLGMIDGYQSMISRNRSRGLRGEMIAYLAANGVGENQVKLSSGEIRSSMDIATGRSRLTWWHRLRFRLVDLVRR